MSEEHYIQLTTAVHVKPLSKPTTRPSNSESKKQSSIHASTNETLPDLCYALDLGIGKVQLTS